MKTGGDLGEMCFIRPTKGDLKDRRIAVSSAAHPHPKSKREVDYPLASGTTRNEVDSQSSYGHRATARRAEGLVRVPVQIILFNKQKKGAM